MDMDKYKKKLLLNALYQSWKDKARYIGLEWADLLGMEQRINELVEIFVEYKELKSELENEERA